MPGRILPLHASDSAQMRLDLQPGRAQVVEITRPTAAFLPCVIEDAPEQFVQAGGDIELLRKRLGVTRKRAGELVLLSVVRRLRRVEAGQIRRAA